MPAGHVAHGKLPPRVTLAAGLTVVLEAWSTLFDSLSTSKREVGALLLLTTVFLTLADLVTGRAEEAFWGIAYLPLGQVSHLVAPTAVDTLPAAHLIQLIVLPI